MVFEKEIKEGIIYLVKIPFVDEHTFKIRPAFLLFKEGINNIFVGITSNTKTKMNGVLLKKEDGLIKESKVKVSLVFTLIKKNIVDEICEISNLKKEEIYNEFIKKINYLKRK